MKPDESQKGILLVEDNEDDVFLAERALNDAKVRSRVFVVTDGEEAVDFLRGAGRFTDRDKFPFPDLVLLDLKLPYRSGLEILAWMQDQKDLPKTVVAVLTSSNQPNDQKRAYELGAQSYLVKPPTGQMIRDVLKAFDLE